MVRTQSKKQKEKSEQYRLFSELTEEILCLLPVKDLLQFRLVCKEWKTIIDSNPFKNKHLQAANNSLLILRKQHGTRQPTIDLRPPTQFLVSRSLPLHLSQFLEAFRCHKNTFPEFNVFGVANGIVCLVYSFCLVLWNPSTRWFRIIDHRNWFQKFLKELQLPERKILSKEFCAFWFDKETEDYKIVIAHVSFTGKALIQLYSSRANSWRGFTRDFMFVGSRFRSDALLDGSFYWFVDTCYDNNWNRLGCGIFRFDFCDEDFKLISLPEDFAARGRSVVVTTRGCLELITILGDGEEQRCEIWAIGDCGLRSRKLRFGLGLQVDSPRGITKDGQVIFISRELGEILLVNPSGSCENLVHSAEDFWVYTYEESLFSIKH